MLMKYHKIFSGMLAVAFILALQLFVVPVPVFRYLVPSFLFYETVITIYNYFYLKSLDPVVNFWMLFRLPFFLLFWFVLFLLLPGELTRGLFLFLSLPVIYYLEVFLGSKGERVTFNEFIFTAVSFFLASFGLFYYFLPDSFPLVFCVAVVFGFLVVMIRMYEELTPLSNTGKWLTSLVLALLGAQWWWVLSFLPFHYSVLGFLGFIGFYSLWAILYFHAFHNLTIRKVQFQIFLFFLVSIIVLFSTRWVIIK